MYGLGAMTAASIKGAQQQINDVLVAQGYEPIKPDGILGPKTCGAARAVNHPSLPDMKCTKFTEPVRAAGGPPIPPPGTAVPPGVGPAPVGPSPAIAPAAEPTAAGMFGLSTKTILIGAAVVGVGIVAVYALKKKSQAAAA
jgi:hypothetical protein